jgi:lipopolysaccharide transport system ATP-binding protein
MLDYGNYGGTRAALTSIDCVPNAAPIYVELGGYLGGIGVDAYQGAAHKSVWKSAAAVQDTSPNLCFFGR